MQRKRHSPEQIIRKLREAEVKLVESILALFGLLVLGLGGM